MIEYWMNWNTLMKWITERKERIELKWKIVRMKG